MCIVLATTAHPSYALIVLNNRDEFILRPTSRPHWWTSQHHRILSARDLQRAEQGTWMGITSTGNLAVLTNYREANTHDAARPVQGLRSRGAMVTAWLTSPDEESTEQFVHRLLDGDGVKGVGGFSLLCGKLRRQDARNILQPLAVMSNRAGTLADVPWIGEQRGAVYGLSNTSYDDPIAWPKVEMGKEKVLRVVDEALQAGWSEEELVKQLFAVLDADTLPPIQEGQAFDDYTYNLRKSIFIPKIGTPDPPAPLPSADAIAASIPLAVTDADAGLKLAEAPYVELLTGIYGTQRQTVLLVDWDGKVTYHERCLYDEKGESIERGAGDMKFDFEIEGWE